MLQRYPFSAPFPARTFTGSLKCVYNKNKTYFYFCDCSLQKHALQDGFIPHSGYLPILDCSLKIYVTNFCNTFVYIFIYLWCLLSPHEKFVNAEFLLVRIRSRKNYLDKAHAAFVLIALLSVQFACFILEV